MSKKTPYKKKPAPAAPGKPQTTKAADHKTTPAGTEKTGKQAPAKPFAIDRGNYKYIGAGLAIMTLGFALMVGGGSKDPNVFNEEALFSFTRITLSTILVVTGFAVEIYAIMKKPTPKRTPKTLTNDDE
ncbi:MAG: DUF3098 domain-containing protein [Prevotellaceae bacterium]|jgi:hypothetical protein|nr:DUF3098 domain-containing protein [Prevotellaceae bacterium]